MKNKDSLMKKLGFAYKKQGFTYKKQVSAYKAIRVCL